MGLDVRSAMERLGVRSLDGLNLREALDLLRRQALRDGAAPPADSPAAPPAPIGRAEAARFEEEDDGSDFELSYPDPDDLPDNDEELADEDFAPDVAAATPPASVTGDVPDLDELLSATAAAPVAAAPAPAQPPQASQEPSEPEEEPLVARARAVIAELRAAHTGGQPTGQQRTAYRHVVVDELGETRAAGVIRAVWSLTPEKLGPEQYDALIRWGKLDTFADEVEAVLELLRAEYRAQQRNAAQSATPGASPVATPPATPTEPAATPAATPAARRRPTQSAPQSAPAEQPPAARPAPRGRSSSAGVDAGARAGSQAGSQGGA
jgi:ribosomal protein L12E/L44/L45/RPP1/RPP2